MAEVETQVNTATESQRPAAFLDRDGVITRPIVRDGRPYPPLTPDEAEVLPGVAEALALLRSHGFLVIVVTNQPDAAAGKAARADIEAINARLMADLAIDDIRVCWGPDGPDCDCYKPKPGMLLAARDDWNIDLGRSVMVGDRWRDIGAGRNAGLPTYFIDRGYDEELSEPPDTVVTDLLAAARHICGLDRNEKRSAEGR